jgi:hypothetical protein
MGCQLLRMLRLESFNKGRVKTPTAAVTFLMFPTVVTSHLYAMLLERRLFIRLYR